MILGYYYQKANLIKKTTHHFKRSNKHVICKLIITHIYFPLSHPSKTSCKGIWNNKDWIQK